MKKHQIEMRAVEGMLRNRESVEDVVSTLCTLALHGNPLAEAEIDRILRGNRDLLCAWGQRKCLTIENDRLTWVIE